MASHPENQQRRSWRQASLGKPAAPSRLGRWTTRILAALAAALLAGVFVWLFWPPPRISRHLVTVTTWGTDRLAAPPIAYQAEDAAALATLSGFEYHHLDEADGAGNGLAGIQRQLSELSTGESGVLLLYVCARGYSEDGQAYLGSGDIDWRRSSRVEVGQLLDGIDGSGAGLKLLVLDVGREDADVRRGFTVNEFPRLLEHQLKQRASSNLWVLLANAPLERSHVSYPLRHGVFATALAEALSGASDRAPLGNGDSMVSLDEVYRYVLQRCRRWFPQESALTQTPLLLKAGEGLVEAKDVPTDDWCRIVPVQSDWSLDSKLTTAARRGPTPAGAATSKAAAAAKDTSRIGKTRTDDSTNGAPATASSAATASAEPTFASPTAAAPDAPKKEELATGASAAKGATMETSQSSTAAPSPENTAAVNGPAKGGSDLAAALHAAWLLRDRLESRGDDLSGVSPVDYAPHLWQEMQAWLVFYEQSLRAGRGAFPERESVNLARELEVRTDDLELLLQAMSGGGASAPARSSVGRRLLEAWEGHLRAAAQTAGGHHPLNRRAEQARRLLYDAAQRAPWYVRWHRTGIMTGAVDEQATERIARFLTALAAAEDLLPQLQGRRRPEEVEPLLAQLEEVERLRREIDRSLVAETQLVLLHIDRPDFQQRADDLLATPLLGAEARRGLIAALLAAAAPHAFDRPASGEIGMAVPPEKWLRLYDHQRLELLLVRWARPAAAERFEALLAPVPRQIDGLGLSAAGTDIDLWQSFRRLGSELGKFYAGLPDDLNARNESELGQTPRLRAGLCLIDPRDATRVELRWLPPPLLTIVLPADLQLTGPDEVVLLDSSPVEFELEIQASEARLLGSGLQWNVECDEQWLDVQKKAESQTQAVAGGRFSKRGTWSISAKKVAAPGGVQTTPVAFSAHWRGGSDDVVGRHNVTAALPLPNRIDLAIARNGAPSPDEVTGTIAQWSLDANRTSRFKLLLANKSGRPQRINAALYAVPAVPGISVAPGRITAEIRAAVFDESRGEFRLPPRLIAQTSEPVTLETDTRPQPLVLAVPGSTNPKGATASAGGEPGEKDKPEAAAPSAVPLDVGRGLVLLVTAAQGEARWLKWIELSPRDPREYLDVEAGLDVESNLLVALIRPSHPTAARAGFPEGDPVLVEWEAAGEAIVQDGASQLAGVLELKDGVVTPRELKLFATVPEDARHWTVRLSINGEPRAFLFEVRRPARGENVSWAKGISARRTARQVRITSLAMADEPRVVHLPPYAAMPPETQAKPEPGTAPPPIVHARQPANKAVVFRDSGRPLTVTLAADAPADAFQGRAGDRLLVWLGDDPGAKTELLADRRFEVALKEVAAGGELVLDASVRDHSVTLSTLGRSNVITYVKAQLEVPGESTAADIVRVQFDGDKPRADLPQRIKVIYGEPLAATVAVRDQSGIQRIRYALLPTDATGIPANAAHEMDVRIPAGEQEVPLSLPKGEVPPGDWKLFVQTMDLTGRWSDLSVSRVTVVDPTTLPGLVKGVIRFKGTVPVNGLLFRLFIAGEGIGLKKIEKIERDGSFEYGPIPPGRYTITAEGSFSNSTVSGKLEGVVPAQRDKLETVIVPVTGK